jgi:hypothetical protein
MYWIDFLLFLTHRFRNTFVLEMSDGYHYGNAEVTTLKVWCQGYLQWYPCITRFYKNYLFTLTDIIMQRLPLPLKNNKNYNCW